MLNAYLVAHTAPQALAENQIVWKNIRITLLTDRLFRLEQVRESGEGNPCEFRFCDEATQTVWFRNLPAVSHSCRKTDEKCTIETAAVRIEVHTVPAESRVTLKDANNRTEASVLLGEANPLPGTTRTLDNCDGDIHIPYNNDLTQAFRIPMENSIVSRSGAAVLDDSDSLVLDRDGMPRPRENPETDWYVFAYGHDYRAAVRDLFHICQAPPVIPRFALGNWWSRYHAYTGKEYLDLMDSFEDRELPFTVATVDMDWHPSHHLPDGEDGWTGYSWNRELFPDYRAFLRELHQRGLHVTLNLHPALGVRWFEDMYPEMARRMGVNPDSRETIPFDITDEKFINAYLEVLHHPYEAEGVDFWWIDWQQGSSSAIPGLDPLWSLNHFHYLDNARNGNGLILSRYAGPGSHRYPLGFSGDTHMTWDTLRFLPSFTACAANAGYTWWSHDIGGHMLGYKNDELYIRFIQFGVFSPINRIHSSNNPMLVKDPAAYPSGVGLIAGEFLRLRHAMIPFLYTAARRTAEQGLALVEPMYYGWPEEKEAYQCAGQYLFGQQLIAAPVTDPASPDGLCEKEVWLPEGRWTDLWNGLTYTGGGWRKLIRGIESFPLLLKEGGFLVLDAEPRGNSTRLPEKLRVIMAGGNGTYTLEEEADGKTLRTEFRMEQTGENTLRLTVRPARPMSLVLEFRTVLEGSAILQADGRSTACRVRRMLDYAKTEVGLIPSESEICLTITETASPLEKRNAAITRMLQRIQADNGLKERLYASLTAAQSRMHYEAAVLVSGLSEHARQQLEEIEF